MEMLCTAVKIDAMALQRREESRTVKEKSRTTQQCIGMEEPRKDSKGIDCNGTAEHGLASRSNGRAMS